MTHTIKENPKNVFEEYARNYDTFYEQKDYSAEVDFLLGLYSEQCGGQPRSVLDMGCGTGGHLVEFVKRGISTRGFDLSEKMADRAREKIAQEKLETYASVETGNLVSYTDGAKYDMVVSLFAVIGYLTSNEELISAFKTARLHLSERGLFICDVWFGPTVLHELPGVRVREYNSEGERIVRIALPELQPADSVVKVHYQVLRFTQQNVVEEIREVHAMRYFFIQELRLLLGLAGLEIVRAMPFMEGNRGPALGDWNIAVVAKVK